MFTRLFLAKCNRCGEKGPCGHLTKIEVRKHRFLTIRLPSSLQQSSLASLSNQSSDCSDSKVVSFTIQTHTSPDSSFIEVIVLWPRCHSFKNAWIYSTLCDWMYNNRELQGSLTIFELHVWTLAYCYDTNCAKVHCLTAIWRYCLRETTAAVKECFYNSSILYERLLTLEDCRYPEVRPEVELTPISIKM